jgi:uncharacterized membrane protein
MTESRIRLDQPRDPKRRALPLHYDPEAFGRSTERIARFLGTGRYLVVQSIFIVLWLIYNVAAPANLRFDPYTFTFLTLILSLQAAYAAPLILLAQNRQDDRDRVNLDQDRNQAEQAKADVEYLAREIAAIRIAVGEVATRDFLRAELSRLEPRDAKERRDKSDRSEKTKAKARDKAQSPDVLAAAVATGSHRAAGEPEPAETAILEAQTLLEEPAVIEDGGLLDESTAPPAADLS